MGFNKCYLPEAKELARQIKSIGISAFLKEKRSAEAFLGPADSVKITDTIMSAFKHGMPDRIIMDTLITTYPDHFA